MTTFARKTAALVLATGLGAAAFGAAPGFAQTVAEFNPQSAVGHWLYDADGELVGSVYSVADGGRTVVVQFHGTYLTPGRHLVSLPAASLAEVQGHATLRTLTADALATAPAAN